MSEIITGGLDLSTYVFQALETFRKAWGFAAWLRLTPLKHVTGSKQRLGAVTQMGK